MQIELVIRAPQRAREMNGCWRSSGRGLIRRVVRIMPYPPSFSRRPARSMEPAIGASTCALGSHRCKPYRGAFTINASRRARLSRRGDQEVAGGVSFNRGR